MAKTITVRFTDEQAVKLAERKLRTLVPTEAFIRVVVEQKLKAEECHN
jgi:hypothetical protein